MALRKRKGVPVERPPPTASARGSVCPPSHLTAEGRTLVPGSVAAWSASTMPGTAAALLHRLLRLISALVGLLDDVAGDTLGAETERYRRSQRYRAEDDQKRRGGELHRYAELRDGGERRVDDDRVAGYVRQQVASCGTPHYGGEEVGQKRCEDQDQDRRDYARDVGDELPQDLRDLPDAESVGGHRDGDDEHEPEHKRPEDGGRGLACLRPVEELLYTAALHPAIEAYGLQDPGDHGLEGPGHDVAYY